MPGTERQIAFSQLAVKGLSLFLGGVHVKDRQAAHLF
jgi:hypothetical protein